MGRHFLSASFRFGLVVAVASCGLVPKPVVLDEMISLKDGEAHAWKVSPGLYRVEMTASGDGATVEWIGGDCAKSVETKMYSGVCELQQDGQVVVSNPTSFGMGAGTTVTVKVTKLGR